MGYKFADVISPATSSSVVVRGSASIPLVQDNRDYVQFLEDWKNGAEVLNPDGTPAPYVAPEPK